MKVADGRGVDSQLREPRVVHVTTDSALHPPRPREEEDTDKRASNRFQKKRNRIAPVSLADATLRWLPPASVEDAGSKVQTLAG